MRSTQHKNTSPPRTTPPSFPSSARRLWLAGLALAGAFAAGPLNATVPVPVATLKGVPVPTPSNLNDFVLDRAAAIRLGKALFWDQQVGSDGQTACASCHFHAGADSRSRNQLNPGQARFSSPTTPAPDNFFQVGGVNYQFKFSDFQKLLNSNDVLGSAGVYPERFNSIGTTADNRTAVNNQPVFHINGLHHRAPCAAGGERGVQLPPVLGRPGAVHLQRRQPAWRA
jgi:Di-haem cytochrome c peroxidase